MKRKSFTISIILVSLIVIGVVIAVISSSKECRIGGCSGQICGEAGSIGGLYTTCEWKEEYACYQQFGRCERQQTGECAWTQNEELVSCLKEKQA